SSFRGNGGSSGSGCKHRQAVGEGVPPQGPHRVGCHRQVRAAVDTEPGRRSAGGNQTVDPHELCQERGTEHDCRDLLRIPQHGDPATSSRYRHHRLQ
ncbi:unnamed protein product, partial [Pylaiella littoralis]